MAYVVCKPRSSPCSTMIGEFAPSMRESNAYDPCRYVSNSHDNAALHEYKVGLDNLQSRRSLSRPWGHKPSSRLNLLMRKGIVPSDTSSQFGNPSTPLMTSSISSQISSTSGGLLQNPLGSSFSHLTTPRERASFTPPVSVSDFSTVGGFSASSSTGGGLNTIELDIARASAAPHLIAITDSTGFSGDQPPLSQISNLLGNPSQLPTQPRTTFTLLTSRQTPQSKLPSTAGGSLTTLPSSSTTVQATSETSPDLTGISTTLSTGPLATSVTSTQVSTSTGVPDFTTVMTSPLGVSSTTSTSTTSDPSSPTNQTTIDPTSTPGPASDSVITSSTSASITTFNTPSSIPESSKEPITSASRYTQPASLPNNLTETFSTTQILPTSRSATESASLISFGFLSTFTSTKYLTITYTSSSTTTQAIVVESGVLNSDKPSPNDNAFAHNTGGIIGVTVSGAVVFIVALTIMFLSCQRHRRRHEREGSSSRETFFRRELELDLADIPSMSPRLPATNPEHYVTNISPHDRGGGFSSGENLSAESAGMYPVQSFASPPVGGVDPTSAWIPGSSVVPNSNDPSVLGISSSDNITRRPSIRPLSTDISIVNQTGMVFLPTHTYPNENPQQTMSGFGSATGSGVFGDGDAYADAASSTSGHGHYSTDGHTTSCFESSCHGHHASNFGLLGSSSGHTVSMSTGGVLTSSSGHGMMGAACSRNRSKSASPGVGSQGQAPPSSYVPPRRRSAKSTESFGGDSTSSVKSLLGKFKSMSKVKDKRKEERERQLSLRHENIRASIAQMAQSSRESIAMSMGHSSTLGYTTSHPPPSSLLNPPNPPIPSISLVPPIPIIRYPDMVADPVPKAYTSQPSTYLYVPPLPPHNPRYSIGVAISDPPYPDVWPPQVSPSIPSLVPTDTDASSYAEGLLNPDILPNPTGDAGISGLDKTNSFGPGDEVIDGTRDGQGVGRYGLWTNEYEGRSTMSLGDHVDYSRPIGVAVLAARSTTTFGTDREVTNETRDNT